MAKWYRTRQNAIDKAKVDTEFTGVNVFHYAEVNQVVDAKFNGKKRVVNCVLPYTNVDFVSYSSYDAQWYDQTKYNSVLDYIEANLPPKQGITGKRVFIGEVGNSLEKSGWDIYRHESDNRVFFKTAIAWGSPFVLYWEMYNNELDANNNNRHRGFWLINDKNEKQPLYYTFKYFYEAAKKYVANYKLINKTLPNYMEYATWASNYLTTMPTAIEIADTKTDNIEINIIRNKLFVESRLTDAFLSVYSISAHLLKEQYLNVNEINEIQLTKGIYVLKIKKDNNIFSRKIIL